MAVFSHVRVSIPSRGFWFFEEKAGLTEQEWQQASFNPLAGILVF